MAFLSSEMKGGGVEMSGGWGGVGRDNCSKPLCVTYILLTSHKDIKRMNINW